MSGIDFYNMVSGIGDAFASSYDRARKRASQDEIAAAIGDGSAPDYARATRAAFAAGQTDLGLHLMSAASSAQGQALGRDALSQMAGMYGGGQRSGLDLLGGPAPASPPSGSALDRLGAPRPNADVPAFTRAATQYGLDPAYLPTVATIESNGNPNAVSPTGARGVLQFTKGTAARYGLTDPHDVDASADAGARLTRDNADTLRGSLGRDPTPGELYLAHQQGAGGASALLRNPGANAVDALAAAYGGDRAKAARAITVNGGSVDMTAGQFASRWINRYDRQSGRRAEADMPVAGGRPVDMQTGQVGFFIPPGDGQQQPAPASPDKMSALAMLTGGGYQPAPSAPAASATQPQPSGLAALYDPAPMGPANGFVRPEEPMTVAGLTARAPATPQTAAPAPGPQSWPSSDNAASRAARARQAGVPLPPARPGDIADGAAPAPASAGEPDLYGVNPNSDDAGAGAFARSGMGSPWASPGNHPGQGAPVLADQPVRYASATGAPGLAPPSAPITRSTVPGTAPMTMPVQAQGAGPQVNVAGDDPPVSISGYDGTWTRASVAAAARRNPDREGIPEDNEIADAQRLAARGQAPGAGDAAPQLVTRPPAGGPPKNWQEPTDIPQSVQTSLGGANIGRLVQIVGNDKIPQSVRSLANVFLTRALDETKMPAEFKEFQIARANGWTKAANPIAYAQEKAGKDDAGEVIQKQVAARQGVAQALGLEPGTPEHTRYVATGSMPTSKDATIEATATMRANQAQKYGLDPSSAEGQRYILTGQLPDPAKMGEMKATEQKMYAANVEKTNILSQQIKDLQKALDLSPQVYSGNYLPGAAQFAARNLPFGGGVDQNRVTATTQYENLVNGATLSQGKELFGARPTNYDEKLLQALKANPNMTPQERGTILQQMIEHRQQLLHETQENTAAMKGGTFFKRGPNAGPPPGQGQGPGQGGRQPAPQARSGTVIPPGAVQALQGRPDLAAEFDAKYGTGAAALILRGQ